MTYRAPGPKCPQNSQDSQAQGDPGLREVALITVAVSSKVPPLVACLLNTPGDGGQMGAGETVGHCCDYSAQLFQASATVQQVSR